MMRRFLGAIAALIIISTGSFQASIASKDPEISAAASAAFSDVGRCLASGKNPKLSVFYLIDSSGSLKWTDPRNERRGIIQGSITELGNFADQGVDVEVSAHFFSTGTSKALGWTEIADVAGAQGIATGIGALIDNEKSSGSTDWQEGLELAYQELSSRGESCKMLVWFTDGGINPDNTNEGKESSLASLCRTGVGYDSLGTEGSYGLMSQFRNAQIPVFGVLYSNLENAYKYFQENSPAEADDLLAEEKWLMSFMRPLVEGRGEVAPETFAGSSPANGTLQCAEVRNDGTAPPEQTNGAFLNAEDPVALAYQFLKLGTQISGASGSLIEGGKFTVPAGTAKFTILVAGNEWEITGPEGSGISGSSEKMTAEIVSRISAGATAVEVVTINNQGAVGEWSLETEDKQAELFLHSGLTFTLDRDKSSKVLSEYPNTITGRVVRTSEFDGFDVDLDQFRKSEIRISVLSEDSWTPIDGVEITKTPSGEFSIANFVPSAGFENLGLLLQLDLGGDFSPVESEFELIVQDKNALARTNTDNFVLSSLIGPDGKAEGTLVIEGPNLQGVSEFCFAAQSRLDDTQTGIEKVDRREQFEWTFTNQNTGEKSSDNCFSLATGEQLPVLVSVTNPIQADSEIVSIWNITSKTEGVEATFEAPVRFQFSSEVVTNQAVTLFVLIALMLLGILLPLLAMWLLNLLTTRFLDVTSVVRASFPVKISANGASPILQDQRPGETGQFKLGTRDFLNVMDAKSPRSYDTGSGLAQARIPLFPLDATWYEWQAPTGARVITSNLSSSKQTESIKSFKAAEISPNLAENWALVISDSELAKATSIERDANLVVFAPAGTIPAYESRIQRILSSPRLNDDIRAAAARVGMEQQNPTGNKKSRKQKAGPTSELIVAGAPSPAPNIPGFSGSQSGSQITPGQTEPPNIPGFGRNPGTPPPSSPPPIPGFGNNPGSSGSQKPPGLND